jgi:hypothetical protein
MLSKRIQPSMLKNIEDLLRDKQEISFDVLKEALQGLNQLKQEGAYQTWMVRLFDMLPKSAKIIDSVDRLLEIARLLEPCAIQIACYHLPQHVNKQQLNSTAGISLLAIRSKSELTENEKMMIQFVYDEILTGKSKKSFERNQAAMEQLKAQASPQMFSRKHGREDDGVTNISKDPRI